MTWVTDGSGTRWIEYPPIKRRKSPRAIRFASIKVGDQVMKTHKVQRARKDEVTEYSKTTWYYVVTDLWFDPVKGQDNHVAGEMVAIVSIKENGALCSRKEPHTKRGLASQGFHYADRDYISLVKQRQEAKNIVGIGYGSVIRQRPKLPGSRL